MAGHDQCGFELQEGGPGPVQLGLILRPRVHGRPVHGPPEVRAGYEAMFGINQGGDVLGCVPRCGHQPHRRRELEPVGRPVGPAVALVDRPEVVEPGALEQRRIQGVVGMVVTEHHVTDVGGFDAQVRQRVEDLAAIRHHPGIDHDRLTVVADQRHGAGHAVVGIAGAQNVQVGGHAVIVAPSAAPSSLLRADARTPLRGPARSCPSRVR